MNTIEAYRERLRRNLECSARDLFWLERLSLFVILLFSYRGVSLLFSCPLFATTLFASFLPWYFPKTSSADCSGFAISRMWLFLLDRFMLLVSLFAYKTVWLWRFTVIVSLAVHYFYITEYLDRLKKTHHAEPIGIADNSSEEVDVSKELEKTRELLEDLKEDGKKIDIEMEFIDNLINSDLETHRSNLSVKLLELRKELRDVGGKIRTHKELMNSFVNSELPLRSNVDHEDNKGSREVASLADQVHEAYFVIQETAKAAKTTSDRAYLIYLFAQEISAQIQKKLWMMKLEDLERFSELKEELRRMSLHFAARRMEAKVAADRAAEELTNATVKLMEEVGIQQLEESKID
ncbi:unnamed protein product [Eruca vesicaria subsp. sativa]|uniref:Uncharacterized protein n=1 Tax=Eruca vesicaria subsp. sativa TaxID=29727 RepID=A0ABC8JVA6_ERUVS|nr:unnamed protein product [Eruca vesicaria subsp. sativa]